jgi:flagellar FliL protein
MAEEDAKPAEAAPAAEAPKRKSKLPLLLSVLVILAGGAAAAWYLGALPIGGKARHAEATAAVPEAGGGEAHDAAAHGATVKGAVGPLLPFEPFIANLADQGGSRYLKATFQLEFLGTTVPAGVDGRLPQIRDLLLTLLTSKTFDEIRTPEGKQQLREEIIARVNQVLERDAVKAVYFTEFIVQ